MAFAIINRFKGGTKEQYDAVVEQVHPPGSLPEGQSIHIAGSIDDGWVVVAVWDSRETWERFLADTLMPGLQAAGDRGFPDPPEVTEIDVEVLLQG